ncbi:MAG: VTT domain-containing protein [Gammaproteobacteria bacterium]|nr:VTT domain-containing protein [Gammaproteobacteria bacterium]
MTELFQQLLGWVELHPYWAGALIFTISMAESLAIIGLLVPGVAIMFGIGAMIGAGSIDFGSTMALAVTGAVVGDGVSFWLGRLYREQLPGIWPFRRYPESLGRGITFFERYGGKSVAIGRFFGPVRAVIPLVAGMLGMPPWRFLLANVLSALAWAPAYLLPGMVFGTSLKLASEVAVRLVIVILLLVFIVWFIVWLVHYIFLLLHPRAARLLQELLNWGHRHPMFEGIASALADPGHPEARGLSVLASLLFITAALFALITGWSLNPTSQSGINYTLLESLQSLRTPWADHLMIFITGLADLQSIALFFALVLTYLIWRRDRRTALYWLAAGAFALLTAPLLKYGLRIPRPEAMAQSIGSYAFPSGHTLAAMVIYGFFSVLIARSITPRWRWIPYSAAGLIIGSVAVSRLYLGVHWLSDVLGSITLGLAWVSALGIAHNRHTTATQKRGMLIFIGISSLVTVLVIQALSTHTANYHRYTPEHPVSEMAESKWWQQEWRSLPFWRQDTRQRLNQQLNVQYAGALAGFASAMSAAGWQKSDPLSWKTMVKLLSPALPLSELPVFPQVHEGSHESLRLIKTLPSGRRLIVRLWPAYIELTPDRKRLWIGLVEEQRKLEIFSLVTFATSASSQEDAFNQFLLDIPEAIQRRLTENGTLLLRDAVVAD